MDIKIENVIEGENYALLDIDRMHIIYGKKSILSEKSICCIAGLVSDFVNNSRANTPNEIKECTDDIIKSIHEIAKFTALRTFKEKHRIGEKNDITIN